MKNKYFALTNYSGYLLQKIPPQILNEIKISIDKIQQDFSGAIPVNDSLAGQIDKEYKSILGPKFIEYIKSSINEFGKYNPNYINKLLSILNKQNLTLEYDGSSWINFQTKHEYNPIHNHSGVFSFVIWYQIPYYKEDEIKYGAGKIPDGRSQNGDFAFIVPQGEEIVGSSLNIDKTMEGHMAIFPSNLHHTVYPFYTSDDYRITISGNIHLK